MKCGRILALDYGTKNVGLACCDELGVTIQPLASLPHAGRRALIERIRGIVIERGISELVVGMPLRMDGSSGTAAARVSAFIKALSTAMDLPIRNFDERLSTVEAQETWHKLKPKRRSRYRTIDSLAAACILERYLKESELCEPA
jgi:putative holliday junction resolvase